MGGRLRWRCVLVGALLWLAGCAGPATAGTTTPGGPAVPLPTFAHIVVVVEENQTYDAVIGNPDAPYLNTLANGGVLFTDAHGVTHPSEPNYLALFAGQTFGLTSDACPQQFSGANLASALSAAGHNFTGYSESLPQAGFTGCGAGGAFGDNYARKHNPWVDFATLPAAVNQPFSSWPADFTRLPTVAFVIPNQLDDMHSGSVTAGDAWLRQHLASYAVWAPAHDSLLIVTWDEDDGSTANHIPTIFFGAHVHAGSYGETINHYAVLRTIEALTGAAFTNQAASAATIADVWA